MFRVETPYDSCWNVSKAAITSHERNTICYTLLTKITFWSLGYIEKTDIQMWIKKIRNLERNHYSPLAHAQEWSQHLVLKKWLNFKTAPLSSAFFWVWNWARQSRLSDIQHPPPCSSSSYSHLFSSTEA